jgi:hypothetical protein
MNRNYLLALTIGLGVTGVALIGAALFLILGETGEATAVAANPTPVPVVMETSVADTAVSPQPLTTSPPHSPIPNQPAAPPTDTPTPSPTDQPTSTPTTTPTPTPPPPPINGLPADAFIILPPDAQANTRQIYAKGQQIGRDPRAYSTLGDSTVLNPHMLARFGQDDLALGQYSYLQPTVNNFTSSWTRYGVAARNGLHSWSVFDPLWANKDWCEPEEHLLACEFRLENPAFLIIRLGSNDAGAPSGFEYNVRQVIEYSIENGVVPIIMTKADRFEGDNTNNEILRRLADELKVPLWDFDIVAETLPERGLADDLIHMKEFPGNDFTDPAIFQSGHGMQDLTGLMMLHAILQTVQSGE